MLATARGHLSAILIILALGVVGYTAPAIGHGEKHSRFAHDAGKVDGLDARTLRGLFAVAGDKDATEQSFAWSDISFGFTLNKAPKPHYIPAGDPAPPQCPGTDEKPKAKPGHLCVYEDSPVGAYNGVNICFNGQCPKTSRFGAQISLTGLSSSEGTYGARGSWAVTIPN